MNDVSTKNHDHRILVLTTSYPSYADDPSGVFVAKLLGALERKGYNLTVVAPSDGTFHGTRKVHGIKTVRFGYFLPRGMEKLTARGGGIPENMKVSLLARIQVVPMMAAFLVAALKNSRGCDIVYANWLGAGIIGAMVNLFTGKPLVVTFRGDDGYLARERTLWRHLTRWVCRRASVIAPVSGELVQILSEDLGISRSKCVLPTFGVDPEMFHPSLGSRKPGEKIRLLFVGSLIERKGLHDLLQALADDSVEHVVLTIVGEGVHGPQMAELCTKLGLDERVVWKGSMPPNEVAKIMRHSDILCLPSYMEGRPNVVNEAMASGLPVISTRTGGIPAMVLENKSALLFDPGDVIGLRECLKTLAADYNLRIEMGKAGYEFVRDSGVSWDATAQEFHDLFQRVIG